MGRRTTASAATLRVTLARSWSKRDLDDKFLRGAEGASIPSGISSAPSRWKIRPAEYRADVVVILLDGDVPVRVLIIEVQLGIDARKRFSWPDYPSRRLDVTGARATRVCHRWHASDPR
jgi:hypothetical protein